MKAERIVVDFVPPREPAKLPGALLAAAMALPPRGHLVYRRGPLSASGWTVMGAARAVAEALGLALVSWPDRAPEGDEPRVWVWAMQAPAVWPPAPAARVGTEPAGGPPCVDCARPTSGKSASGLCHPCATRRRDEARFGCNPADRFRVCAAQGMSKAETARHLGVTPSRVTQMARKLRLTFRSGNAK